MARALVKEGMTSLRFDFSGIGDSEPRRDGLIFEQAAVQEIRDAMDLLAHTRGIGRFILAGLCSGADMAFYGAQADERVIAIGQLDPFVYRTRYFYLMRYGPRLTKPTSWMNLVTGRNVIGRRLRGRTNSTSRDAPTPDMVPTPYWRAFPPRDEWPRDCAVSLHGGFTCWASSAMANRSTTTMRDSTGARLRGRCFRRPADRGLSCRRRPHLHRTGTTVTHGRNISHVGCWRGTRCIEHHGAARRARHLSIMPNKDDHAWSRRAAIGALAVAGAGLGVYIWLSRKHRVLIPDGPRTDAALAPDAFLGLQPDGSSTLVTGATEMGQGIHTALGLIVAEALDAGGSIHVTTAPENPAFYNCG
jgi:hypothetical protein